MTKKFDRDCNTIRSRSRSFSRSAFLKFLCNSFCKSIFHLVLFTFAVCTFTGCDQTSDDRQYQDNPRKSSGYAKSGYRSLYSPGKKPKPSSHATLWERIRRNYEMSKRRHQPHEREKIQRFVNEISSNEKYLARVSHRASPYLHFIVEELEKRDMPGELALLPMIESAFEPKATSRKGAAGLWQFIPGTGRQFGLKQDKWYDGRRDVIASTRAALDYLQFLHKEFDGNWMLALAAYNAGPGTVHRAIKKNQDSGKPTNFWSLKLPKETQHYVPKFLALAEVVADPNKHEVSLAHIENKPYFASVDPGKQVNLTKLAELANMNVKELKQLNAAYRRTSTHPKGPSRIILPIQNAELFEDNLAKNKLKEATKVAAAKPKLIPKPKVVVKPKVIAKPKVVVKAKVVKPKVVVKPRVVAKSKVVSGSKPMVKPKVVVKSKAIAGANLKKKSVKKIR